MRKHLLAILVALWLPGAAAAEPISAALAAINAFAAASAINAFVVRIATAFVLSALSTALRGKPDRGRQAGIKTEAATTGGSNPQTFIVGRYATGGNLAAPPYSQPNSGNLPNKYLTYVIDLSDIPGATLSRLMVNNQYVTDLEAGTNGHQLQGMILNGQPHVFLSFYDGSQTAADPYLLANFGADPDRPWLADMVGVGVSYAVVTFLYNREVFNALPGVRFEVDGIPLYDPRLDSTVGGSGAARADDPTTWTQTDNPMVMVYNILRGIALPDGNRWGGAVADADLPLDSWFSAMNECDQAIALTAGGTEPQYRAGFEVSVDDEPVGVIEELLKACSAEICEFGGVYKPRVGPPALPVYVFSDDDLSADDGQRLIPYPGLDGVHNGIHATHPAPDALWESRDAPPIYNATYEAEDGARRLVAQVTLPAVSSDTQVQRLMQAWLKDNRRFRRHGATLPPEAAILEPLDAVAWASARNGYTSKVFEVGEITDHPRTLFQGVALRERDAADFSWLPADEVAVDHPVTIVPVRAPRTVPGWGVLPENLVDGTGAARRPALRLVWDGSNMEDATGLQFEVRPVGQTALVAQGTATDLASGALIVAGPGLLPAADYEARGRLVSTRATAWTAWAGATTPGLFISEADFDDINALFEAAGLSVPYRVTALPAAGPARWIGERVFLETDLKIYRWDGAGWTASVPTGDLSGLVAQSQLTIADTSNLCEDPGFELAGLGWGAAGGTNGFFTVASNPRTGAYAMIRQIAAGAGTFTIRNNAIFDARAGDAFRLSAWVRKGGALANCTSMGVRIYWLDAAKAQISTSAVTIAQASLTTSYQRISNLATAPAGATWARVELIINGHTGGDFYWDDIYCYRANAGELIVDGTIYGNHLVANTITGGLLAATGIITGSAQIGDGLITNAKIGNLAVDSAKISDLAVTGAKIANLSVDTLQVANSAISSLENAFTAGTIHVAIQDGDVIVQTLVVDKGRADPLPFWTSAAVDSVDNFNITVSYKVWRNGVQIGGSGEFVDTTTATGLITYTLTARSNPNGAPLGGTQGATISNRLIAALNMLR